MHRVLLHLSKRLTLENVAKESVMSFLEAIEIVLEDLIVSFKYLDFSKRQRCVMPVFNLVKVEDVSIDCFNVEVFYQLSDIVLFKHE